MITNCRRQMLEGVTDAIYLERRLEQIEVRIDDLCQILGEVSDALTEMRDGR